VDVQGGRCRQELAAAVSRRAQAKGRDAHRAY
jgi:hypothetical protein